MGGVVTSPRGAAEAVQARRAFCSGGGKAEVGNAHAVAEGRGCPSRGRLVGQQQILRFEIPVTVCACGSGIRGGVGSRKWGNGGGRAAERGVKIEGRADGKEEGAAEGFGDK